MANPNANGNHQPKPQFKSNTKAPQQSKPHYSPKPKAEPSYTGQPRIRVELSPVRVNGCSTTEFLAWIRQQEGRV